MPTAVLPHRRAWRAETIDASSSWYYRLTDDCLACLDRAVEDLRREPRDAATIPAGEYALPAESDFVRQVSVALEHGRGFAVIDGLPFECLTKAEATAAYWIVGHWLGVPFAQNVQGTLLYDVRDTGRDLSQGARFSVTNYESSFHTDNSFGAEILDYVGLLCLQPAKAGGLSQVLSGFAVLEELRNKHPDVLAALSQPWHVDRRGGLQPGESPTARIPIIQEQGPDLLVRYLRYWIEVGHEKAEQPLTAAQKHALDLFDGVLRQRDLAAEFMLRPGQMFFMNNRWLLHNRTAFEDYPEFERRRHYVRLWLKARPGS
jgi:alpha-ketoglutarate-dependent taurine dioxygenase